MAVVDPRCMCVRWDAGYWWKMGCGRLAGTNQGASWTQLRSLPPTQKPRSHEKVRQGVLRTDVRRSGCGVAG